MNIIKVSNVGNIKKGYVTPRFESEYRGLCFDPVADASSWIIKDYALKRAGRRENLVPHSGVEALLRQETATGKLDVGLGLGFIMTSEGVINLSVWREDFPHLPKQTIWTLDGAVWKKADLNAENSYCIGEGAIYSFERDAWHNFLRSRKGTKRKEEYINSIMPAGPIVKSYDGEESGWNMSQEGVGPR